jgi:hypothetical protein
MTLHRYATLATAVLLAAIPATAQKMPLPLCDLAVHEEQVELEDVKLEVELARASVAAFGEIFKLIDGLWKADAIDRMSFLRGKYDYDAAKLTLERNDLLLRRQEALLEQYTLVCEGFAKDDDSKERRQAIERAHQRYRRADCDQQAKAIEVARVNLEFRREYLQSVLDLRAGEVATRQQVILAELDVEQEEQRLADAEKRVAACRRLLGDPAP